MGHRTPERFDAQGELMARIRTLGEEGYLSAGGWGVECRSDGIASGGTLLHRDGRRFAWEERQNHAGGFKEALGWAWQGPAPTAFEWRILDGKGDGA